MAELDGEIVGCGALHVLWADLGEVRTVAVHPKVRGHGVGHAVVDAAARRRQESAPAADLRADVRDRLLRQARFRGDRGHSGHRRGLRGDVPLLRHRRRRVPRPVLRQAQHPRQHPDAVDVSEPGLLAERDASATKTAVSRTGLTFGASAPAAPDSTTLASVSSAVTRTSIQPESGDGVVAPDVRGRIRDGCASGARLHSRRRPSRRASPCRVRQRADRIRRRRGSASRAAESPPGRGSGECAFPAATPRRRRSGRSTRRPIECRDVRDTARPAGGHRMPSVRWPGEGVDRCDGRSHADSGTRCRTRCGHGVVTASAASPSRTSSSANAVGPRAGCRFGGRRFGVEDLERASVRRPTWHRARPQRNDPQTAPARPDHNHAALARDMAVNSRFHAAT